MIRLFRAFYSKLYIVISVILFPVTVLAFTLCASGLRTAQNVTIPIVLTVMSISFMTITEILNDHFQFGGNLSHDERQMELFRTSVRGDDLYARVLKIDTLRKTLTYAITFLVSIALNPSAGGLIFTLLSWMWFIVALALRIIRRFSGINALMLTIYLSMSATGIICGVCIAVYLHWRESSPQLQILLWAIGLVIAAAGALLTITTYQRALRVWKEQYHD